MKKNIGFQRGVALEATVYQLEYAKLSALLGPRDIQERDIQERDIRERFLSRV